MQHASYEWRIFLERRLKKSFHHFTSLETTDQSFRVPRVLRKEGWGAWAAATTQRWQQQPAKANFWLFKGWGLCCKRWGEFPMPSKQKSQKSDHPKLGAYDLEASYLLEGNICRDIRDEKFDFHTWMKDQRIKSATAGEVHHHRSFSLSYRKWAFE